jgi:hypothetical protein
VTARRSTYGKVQRDRAKQAKAAAKRARRQSKGDEAEEAQEPQEEAAPARPALSESEVLARLEKLHEEFDAGTIDFEKFEEEKELLTEQLNLG